MLYARYYVSFFFRLGLVAWLFSKDLMGFRVLFMTAECVKKREGRYMVNVTFHHAFLGHNATTLVPALPKDPDLTM
jgi:hypothetical protein